MSSPSTPLRRSPRLAALGHPSNTPSPPVPTPQPPSVQLNALPSHAPPAAASSASAQPTAQDNADAASAPSNVASYPDRAAHTQHPIPTQPNVAPYQVPPAATQSASAQPAATQDSAGVSSAPTASQALRQKRLLSDAFTEYPQAEAKKVKGPTKGKGKAPPRDRKPMRQMELSWAKKGAVVGEGPGVAGSSVSVEDAGLGKENVVLGEQQRASAQAQNQTQRALQRDNGEGSSGVPSTWKSELLPTTTICKTYALDSYKPQLKPIHLASLAFTFQTSKNEREMHLYSAREVEQLAWKIHGGPQGLKKMLDAMEKEHARKGNKTPFRRPVYERILVRGEGRGRVVSERLVRKKI